jgi:hypothetical protein
MSTTKSSGTDIASRTSAIEQFPLAAVNPWIAGDRLSPAFINKARSWMQERFGEKFRLGEVDASLEEYHELAIFDDFLSNHVQANRICDVQCMLLWSEWVRYFRRNSSGFPNLIHEKEFRNIITDTFSAEISDYGFRGAVYTGVKFVHT